jgi:hypothetical protein
MLKSFSQFINENSEQEVDSRLADLTHLYDLGMIDQVELVRSQVRIKSAQGQPVSLTRDEVSLFDPDLAEELEEWVKDYYLDFKYEFESTEEEEEFDYRIERYDYPDINWKVYLNNTLDVSVFYPGLGPEQRIYWEDANGRAQSKDILDYYAKPLMRELDPNSKNGRIELYGYIEDHVQEFFSDILEE